MLCCSVLLNIRIKVLITLNLQCYMVCRKKWIILIVIFDFGSDIDFLNWQQYLIIIQKLKESMLLYLHSVLFQTFTVLFNFEILTPESGSLQPYSQVKVNLTTFKGTQKRGIKILVGYIIFNLDRDQSWTYTIFIFIISHNHSPSLSIYSSSF